MKVLISSTNSDIFSGASKCLLDLAQKLRDRKINVVVLLPRNGPLEQELKKFNVKYYIVKEFQSWYIDNGLKNKFVRIKRIANLTARVKIKRVIKYEHIDIVHVNASTAYAAALAAEQCHIPVVWHLREFLEEDLGITFFDKKYSEKIMNQATMAIAISQAVKDKWTQRLQIPIQVIHDGVPIENYYIERKYEAHKRLNILIYGRIVPQKGQLFFFQAMAKYVKLYGNEKVQCSWAGMIEDQNYYDSIIAFQHENNMKAYCNYLGEVSDMKSVLRDTDIVAMCSEMEGFGRVTVESMLAGTIVIGADTGATKELIQDGENGYLYKSHDVDSFVDRLHTIILSQEKALQAAKRGQVSATEEYSLEHDVEQVIKVYRKILSSSSDKDKMKIKTNGNTRQV